MSGSPSSNMPVDDVVSHTHKRKRARHSKSASISSSVDVVVDQSKKNKKGDDDVMMIDADGTATATATTVTQSEVQVPATPSSPPRPPRKPRKSAGGGPITPGVRTKAKPKSPLASSFTPPSPPAEDDDVQMHDKAPLSLPRAVVEIVTERDGSPKLGMFEFLCADGLWFSDVYVVIYLYPAKSQSRGELQKPSTSSLREEHKADSDVQPDDEKEKPKRKPRAKKSTTTSTSKPTSKKTPVESTDDQTSTIKPKSSSRTLRSKCSAPSLKPTTNTKPVSSSSTESTGRQKPVSKAGSVRKKRGKALAEVVATSMEGEENI